LGILHTLVTHHSRMYSPAAFLPVDSLAQGFALA